MEETATLIIRVQSDQADAAKKRLNDLGYAADVTEKATGKLTAAWKGLGSVFAGFVSIGTALAGLNKLKDVATQFESLEAQLKTATGSAENAKVAFEALQDFAKQTPYDLAQSTEAFIKLVNLGLTPSERALRSYGDTASAMGQSLSDMVNAVSRATTGEFMPLKTFGIKAAQEADGLAFTFRGVKTIVQNSAKDIENYFIELGEKNFTGAMAERMKTLEGLISNLGDAWDFMFASIAKAGASDLMKKIINEAISAITELTGMIASGELPAYFEAAAIKIESIVGGLSDTFISFKNSVQDAFDQLPEVVKEDVSLSMGFLIQSLKNLPENFKVLAGGITGLVRVGVEGTAQLVAASMETLEGFFNYMVETAENVGKEIWSHLKPGADAFDYTAAQTAAFDKFWTRTTDGFAAFNEELGKTTTNFEKSITGLLDERDVALAAFDAKIAKAKQLRSEYEKNIAVERALQEFFGKMDKGDRLGKFGVGSEGTSTEFDELVKKLRSSGQVLDDEHQKRIKLIRSNTKEESDEQIRLLVLENERYNDARRDMINKDLGQNVGFNGDDATDKLNIQLAELDDEYAQKQKKLKEHYEAMLISDEEYAERSTELEKRHSRDSEQIQQQKQQHQLGLASDFFGNLSKAASVFGAKGAKVAKALAIVQATIETYKSATSAYSSLAGIPYVGPVLGAAAAAAAIAAGMANVAAIKSQNYAGAFAGGGFIPAGQWGITQEAGAEVTHGPTVVTSARATAEKGKSNSNSGMPPITVNIINNAGAKVETRERDTFDGKVIDIMVDKIDKQLAGNMRAGRGQLPKAFESTYNQRRGTT